ncbi:MAG: preprotein translocase subunit SecE [Oscillospiraceae bacterium]|nr:preprotein translocase subunit SecE [Oscillospiraceae bacterium]
MLKKVFSYCISYCKDSYEELAHKTTWPNRKELTHSAIVVLTASIVIAIVVFLMDTVFENLMQLIYPQI